MLRTFKSKGIQSRKSVGAVLLLLLFIATALAWTRTATMAQKIPNRITQAAFVPGRILVQFHSQTPAYKARSIVLSHGAHISQEIPKIGVQVVELPDGANEADAVKAFAALPEVEFAELDWLFRPDDVTPNDPNYSSEWYLKTISAPAAWSLSTGSSDVIIAIIDTGVDSTHPDLSGKIAPGWNFFDNNSDTRDVVGHGTAVAGAAAASSNNGVGVASVAWGCLIIPVRVSNTQGNASASAIANGLRWAADNGARVANISYNVTGNATVTSAAKYFQQAGGVVTVSAGNDAAFNPSPDNKYVLTVSATDNLDNLAYYSNTGNNIDLSAPGSVIYTTLAGGGYGYASGTSFSAPIVAGAAGLVMSANSSLIPTKVQDILKQSADEKGAPGWDPSYGSGRLNAANAVALALAQGGNPRPHR
jgi:subtilisin family serine protease